MGSRIAPRWLEEGMRLAADVVTDDGAVMFPKGKELAREDIENIRAMDVSWVVVEGDDIFFNVLKKEAEIASDEIKRAIEKAFKYCSFSPKETEQFKLLGIKYRSFLATKS